MTMYTYQIQMYMLALHQALDMRAQQRREEDIEAACKQAADTGVIEGECIEVKDVKQLEAKPTWFD